jgi:hypothetical protein
MVVLEIVWKRPLDIHSPALPTLEQARCGLEKSI